MRFEPVATSGERLDTYANLFAVCFPGARHLDRHYLRWLYQDNPAGSVVGYDAWEGDRLAAHYVCVPASVRLGGSHCRALLSLNTATHPQFQGKGLFTELAQRTYAAGLDAGFAVVYGFANANSTPGFVRKLGFQLVTPLDSWIGIGRRYGIQWEAVARSAFARTWTPAELAWRLANPANPVQSVALADGSCGFLAATGRPGIQAWAQLGGVAAPTSAGAWSPQLRVFIGKLPSGAAGHGAFVSIPKRLRPSPLNMIVRGLKEPVALDPENLFVSFLDFDAF